MGENDTEWTALFDTINMQNEYHAGLLSQEVIDSFDKIEGWGWDTVPTKVVVGALKTMHKHANYKWYDNPIFKKRKTALKDYDEAQTLFVMISLQDDYNSGRLSKQQIRGLEQNERWNWKTVPTSIVAETLNKAHDNFESEKLIGTKA
jgi:hypothetical protein